MAGLLAPRKRACADEEGYSGARMRKRDAVHRQGHDQCPPDGNVWMQRPQVSSDARRQIADTSYLRGPQSSQVAPGRPNRTVSRRFFPPTQLLNDARGCQLAAPPPITAGSQKWDNLITDC